MKAEGGGGGVGGFRNLQVYLSIYKWSPFTLFQTPDGILLPLNWPSQPQQTQKRGIQHFQGYLYFPGVFIKLQKSIISQGLKSLPSFFSGSPKHSGKPAVSRFC